MRILWLNAGLLLPLDKGGKLRTWHLMRHLAQRHEITYVSFADPEITPAAREGMREVCQHLYVIPRREAPKRSPSFYAGAARHVFNRLPYAVSKYRSPAYRETVDRLLAKRQFDLLVCDFLVPAVNLPAELPCPSVLFTHNVEAEIWRRHYERQSQIVMRALLRQQWQRMQRFEGETVGRFDLVLAVSDTDCATLRARYRSWLRGPVTTVPTGVDTSFFSPRPVVPTSHLVFTGSMDWLPNEDAMIHFCRDVLPFIRARHPDVTVSIVGRSPTPAVRRLGDIAGVDVTGRVDDVRGHIANAAVYIVPIRIGGGTRLKIFEAMAMGKAVVSTTVGAEGLPVADGHNIVIADADQAFADAVVALLEKPARREQLERAARELVAQHYDWSAAAERMDSALTAVRDGRNAVPRCA